MAYDNLRAAQGKMLEAVVVNHLQHCSPAQLYMYETPTEELDCLLIYPDSTCKVIEVKAYADVQEAIKKSISLLALEHSYYLRYPCTEKILVCYATEEHIVIADNGDSIRVIPADKFLTQLL